MDTSKEYIDMCRKAVKIQESWKPEIGDSTENGIITNIINHNSIIVYCNRSGHFPEFGLDELIWLPCQGKLQDMLDNSANPARMHQLLLWAGFEIDTPPDFRTWEQLWLAFVMHEKYGKKWNERDWVTTSTPQI